MPEQNAKLKWTIALFHDLTLLGLLRNSAFYDTLFQEKHELGYLKSVFIFSGLPDFVGFLPTHILWYILVILDSYSAHCENHFSIMNQYFNEKISDIKDKEYENIIKRQVQASKIDAEKDGVVVPVTMEEYCMKVWLHVVLEQK